MDGRARNGRARARTALCFGHGHGTMVCEFFLFLNVFFIDGRILVDAFRGCKEVMPMFY